jgi:hypothetical protein
MTQITLEFSSESELARLLEVLQQFEVRIVKTASRKDKKHREMEEFYNQFRLDLSNFKFDREEANER